MNGVPFLMAVGAVLIAFFAISFIAQRLKVPSVLAFILLGLVVSPYVAGSDYLSRAAELGIALLFFVRGLEFPLSRMLSLSKRVAAGGLIDIIVNLGGTMLLALILGFSPIAAFFLGSIAYATSSSITAKLIEERKRTANPETEFLLGVLIFEDLLAPILIMLLAGMGSGAELSPLLFVTLLLRVLLLTGGAVLLGTYGFSRLGAFVTSHIERDFMPLLIVGIALLYAGIAIRLGFSEALGAFLAGVMLSETGRSAELNHLLFPIRDATLPFFFFYFGIGLNVTGPVPMGALSVLVLWGVAGKILAGFMGGRLFGLTNRVSLRAGFSFIPRGEFSAIIAALAASELRIVGGIYILLTAVLGVVLFERAPQLARRFFPGTRPVTVK
ncbi:MAG TPA: cation:proton antiporter [Bacillota bacterium]|nr:cation:proton antiporter [Bacillota bacterium]